MFFFPFLFNAHLFLLNEGLLDPAKLSFLVRSEYIARLRDLLRVRLRNQFQGHDRLWNDYFHLNSGRCILRIGLRLNAALGLIIFSRVVAQVEQAVLLIAGVVLDLRLLPRLIWYHHRALGQLLR